MSKIIDVKIEGVAELKKAFSKSPVIVANEMKDAIYSALLLLQGSAREFVPKDTSNLASQIRPQMINSLHGELNANTQYALYVHEGTRPHYPPLIALEPWARRHGIPAILVQRAIGRNGTKPRPFMTQAREAQDLSISRIFEKALEIITLRLAQ